MSGNKYLFDDDENRIEGLSKSETEALVTGALPSVINTNGITITTAISDSWNDNVQVVLPAGKYFLIGGVTLTGDDSVVTIRFSSDTTKKQSVYAPASAEVSANVCAYFETDAEETIIYLQSYGSGSAATFYLQAVAIGGTPVNLDEIAF